MSKVIDDIINQLDLGGSFKTTSTFEDLNESNLLSDSNLSENFKYRNFADLLELLNAFEYEDTDTEAMDKFLELLSEEKIDSSSSDLDENKINNDRLESFKNEKTSKFLNILQEEQFEYGYASESEYYIRELFEMNELATKSWLNNIYIEYFNNPNVLIGILRVIGRFEQYEISPVGETIALASLSHKNPEVIESGIRVFENWGSKENIEILQNLDIQESWLKDYLNQVIEDLM